MTDRTVSPIAPSPSPAIGVSEPEPVREYVGDFAGQLALMAREAGDEALALALEAAVDLSIRPPAHRAFVAAPLKRRA